MRSRSRGVSSLLVVLQLGWSIIAAEIKESFESTGDKRALSSFDTLGGIGLGKRAHLSSIDSLGGLGLGKRALNSIDTLAGIGLGKRTNDAAKKALSSFDTLGGIGLGKRDSMLAEEKKSVSSFDTLAGIGLGKRAGLYSAYYFFPQRAYLDSLESQYRNEQD